MPKSRLHLKRRKKGTKSSQIVFSEPQIVLKESYLSPKGVKLLRGKEITKKEANIKYGKNRYSINPKAIPVKTIFHHG